MATIPETLVRAATRHPDSKAISDGPWQLTYRALLETVLGAASVLKSKGLKKGERFGIWAPNCAEWIIAALAGQSVGAILVTLNTRFKGAEAADILRRSGCRFLFTVDGFLDTDYPKMLEGHGLPDLKEVILLRDGASDQAVFQSFLTQANGDFTAGMLEEVHSDDISDIIYTSGTTGTPKGVMTTHGQNVAVFEVFTTAIGMTGSDRYLVVNPFFHSFGYKAGWLSCLIKGAAIHPVSVFDPAEVLRRIEAEKITVMPGAPTVFQMLLDHPDLAGADISSLRVATTGATTIPVDLIRRMNQDLGIDDVFSAYGLTESSGVVTLCQRGDDFETIATTCGRPLPETELRVVDDDGNDVEQGEQGEIWVRGFNVMKGYLDDPQATADTMTEDGWLKTGDIGVRDARGYVRITDRKKDMIIVGGFNCYPAEIEQNLMTHELIKDVAVTGMADERLGEVPQAFVVVDGEVGLSEAIVIEWARERMANFKVPRQVTFLSELPRNASGKVLKYQLGA